MSRLCWNCKHFLPDDSETLLSGQCRRNAARGRDYNSYQLTRKRTMMWQTGIIDTLGAIQSAAVVPMRRSGLLSDLPTCHATDATGSQDNDIIPLISPINQSPVQIHAYADLMNSGAATVADTVYLPVTTVRVNGSDQTVLETYQVPIVGSLVGVNGNTTDADASGTLDINANWEYPNDFSGPCGVRVDLTGTTEDVIAEVRNLQIVVVTATYFQKPSNLPNTAKYKYGQILDGSDMWCGEFSLTTETIPVIPTP